MKKNIISFILLAILCLCFVILAILGYKGKSSNPNKLVNSTPIIPEMVLIPGGTIEMKNEKGEIHKFKVNSFYIGKYEVTNKEFYVYYPEQYSVYYPEQYSVYYPEKKNPDDNLPVVIVDWYSALSYCNWLNKKTGSEPCQKNMDMIEPVDITKKGYRLPTEVEWEYACLAGTKTKYYWGDEMDGKYCWYKDNTEGKVREVGKKPPNPFGLYDMIGNASEWCIDYGSFSPEPDKTTLEPYMSNCIIRGGDCLFDMNKTYRCPIVDRNSAYPALGFRLARTP